MAPDPAIEWIDADGGRGGAPPAVDEAPRRRRWPFAAVSGVVLLAVLVSSLWPQAHHPVDPVLLWPEVLPEGATLVHAERAAPGEGLSSPLAVRRTSLVAVDDPGTSVLVEWNDPALAVRPPADATPVDLGGVAGWASTEPARPMVGWVTDRAAGLVTSSRLSTVTLARIATQVIAHDGVVELAGYRRRPTYDRESVVVSTEWALPRGHLQLQVWREPLEALDAERVPVGDGTGVLQDGQVTSEAVLVWSPGPGVVARLVALGIDPGVVATSMTPLSEEAWTARVAAAGVATAPRQQRVVARRTLDDGRLLVVADRGAGPDAPCLALQVIDPSGAVTGGACEHVPAALGDVVVARVPAASVRAEVVVAQTAIEATLLDLPDDGRLAVAVQPAIAPSGAPTITVRAYDARGQALSTGVDP